MNFGKWIFVSFVAFAGYIGTLVVITMREDVNLVSREYYAEELAYQEKLDRKENANALPQKPTIKFSGSEVIVTFDPSVSFDNGVVILQRPSDSSMDLKFPLQPGVHEQRYTTDKLKTGLYRASVTWNAQGKGYYVEQLIVR